MKYAVERPVTPSRVRTQQHTRYPYKRSQAAVCAALAVFFLALFNTGCGTTVEQATCEQLAGAADTARCPERVIDRPVPQPATFKIPAPADAPALTSAALEDPTVLEALRAVGADLAATRSWGWQLYYQLMNIKAANDALRDPE